MGEWDRWIGREEERCDWVGTEAVDRWLATFDRLHAVDGNVPQGYHWCLCTPEAPTGALGLDGHPRRDDGPLSFLPPVMLPRRMWASSKIEFHAPLCPGDGVRRRSKVQSVTAKQGGSGQLVFVDVAHETSIPVGLAVREVQSLVYRAPPEPGTPPAPPPLGEGRFDPSAWQAHRALVPSETLLFRYSALTFNSHRIHYDAPYAMNEENYRGLVVHGPLTATLLLDLAARELGDNTLKTFTFRGASPAICGEELNLVMRAAEAGYELGAFAADGRKVMSASATC